MIETLSIDRLLDRAIQPSMECAVCLRLSNPKADVIDKKFWLCPACLAKLRKLIGEDGDA